MNAHYRVVASLAFRWEEHTSTISTTSTSTVGTTILTPIEKNRRETHLATSIS